jgi:hypothetical protein
MDKISARQAVAVLSEVPGTLRKLAAERDSLINENAALREQLNNYQLTERVEKVAQSIHDKSVHQGRTMEETKQVLMAKAAAGELDVVAQAVELTAKQQPLGYLGSKESGNPESDFISGIMG